MQDPVRSSRSAKVLAWVLLLLAAIAPAVAQNEPAGDGAADRTTYTYDANGNRTSKLEAGVLWTYVYDARDRLVEVRRDGVLVESYGYDFLDRRILKRTGAEITRYSWDGARLLHEQDGAGRTTAKYEYAGGRLLSLDHFEEGRGSFLFDATRSPVGIVGPDGVLRARYSWDAWGGLRRSVGSSPSPFGFTGHQLDETTGLYYAGARYYDPALGIFLGEDPLFGELDAPASLHRYLYAYANPTVYWDPDGRESLRQLLDPEQDFMADRLVVGAAKFYLYNFWNAFTFGFVGEHDQIYETRSGGDYLVETALAAGKAGTKAYVVAQTGGAGAAFTQAAGLGAVAGGALSGAAVGLSQTAVDDVFALADGGTTHSLGDYALSGGLGATLGAGAGATARLVPAAPRPPSTPNAAALRARVLENIAESQAARQVSRFSEYAARSNTGLPGGATMVVESPNAPGVVLAHQGQGVAPSEASGVGLRILNPHFTPDPKAVLQAITNAQNRALAADPRLAQTVLSPREYAAAQRSVRVAPMQYGNALERLVDREIRSSSLHRSLFEHQGGPRRPDFVGQPGSVAQSMNFDITTRAQIAPHLRRPGYGLGLNVITYERPRQFRLFPPD